jgi:CRP-like cAMP-binding protein
VLKFDLGQLILSENEENKYIWRVKEGEVKLQRANSSLSILGVGAIFGELSIFSSRNKMNAAVISNMASTEVYRISPPLLWTLFESDPQLGYRFYRWLAAKLCRRLLTYAQTGKPRGLRRTESVMWVKDDDDAKTVKRDLQFIQKFNLPPNEVLIKGRIHFFVISTPTFLIMCFLIP